jgi:hypothetical protein
MITWNSYINNGVNKVWLANVNNQLIATVKNDRGNGWYANYLFKGGVNSTYSTESEELAKSWVVMSWNQWLIDTGLNGYYSRAVEFETYGFEGKDFVETLESLRNLGQCFDEDRYRYINVLSTIRTSLYGFSGRDDAERSMLDEIRSSIDKEISGVEGQLKGEAE